MVKIVKSEHFIYESRRSRMLGLQSRRFFTEITEIFATFICRRERCDPERDATEPSSRLVLAKSVLNKFKNKTYSDSVFYADHEYDLRN
jgi:hypothetical protein